jgi:hypothetical protein
MRKVTLTFGLLAGAIIAGLGLVHWSLYNHDVISMDKSVIIGYGSMVVALSMVFFGIKSYRDNHQKGAIKFLKGVQVGMLITLFASLIYALCWEGYLLTRPGGTEDFMKKYTESYINNMKTKGATEAEIEQTTKRMADMGAMYKNPVIRFGMTLFEILPVGIAITLISAAVLRREGVLRA